MNHQLVVSKAAALLITAVFALLLGYIAGQRSYVAAVIVILAVFAVGFLVTESMGLV